MIRRALKNVAHRMLSSARPTPEEPAVHRPPTHHALPRATAPQPEPEPMVEISARQVARWVSDGKNPLFVDVRERHELMSGYPAGASLIPMNQVPNHLDALPHDRPIVVVCAVGGRSYGVAHFLRERGFADAWSLEGGVGTWFDTGAAHVALPAGATLPLLPADALAAG